MKNIRSKLIPAINILKDQRGSIFSIGHFAVLFMIALTLINMVGSYKKTERMRYRAKNYLCTRYLNLKTTQYIDRINFTNNLIKKAFLLSKTPIPYVQTAAKITLEALKVYQESYHSVSYMKNIVKNPYCESHSGTPYIINLPYKMKGKVILFKRRLNKTTWLKKETWDISTTTLSERIDPIDHFVIKTTFSVDKQKRLAIKTEEKEIRDLWNWKQLFGLASSFR